MEGIVRAVCLSQARGTEKVNAGRAELRADWWATPTPGTGTGR